MRRVVLVIASLAVMYAACRTTQPPGTENQVPIQNVTTEREPLQNVPDEPPGPVAPMPPAPSDGGMDAGLPSPGGG
jgi:PBP1b-binding outer membrane lipoprotein LpoB